MRDRGLLAPPQSAPPPRAPSVPATAVACPKQKTPLPAPVRCQLPGCALPQQVTGYAPVLESARGCPVRISVLPSGAIGTEVGATCEQQAVCTSRSRELETVSVPLLPQSGLVAPSVRAEVRWPGAESVAHVFASGTVFLAQHADALVVGSREGATAGDALGLFLRAPRAGLQRSAAAAPVMPGSRCPLDESRGGLHQRRNATQSKDVLLSMGGCVIISLCLVLPIRNARGRLTRRFG